jgi:carbonic anhydrase
MAFLGTGTLSSVAYADALTAAQRDKLSPDDILTLMKERQQTLLQRAAQRA